MKKQDNLLFNASLFLLPFSLFIGLGITRIINTVGSDSWISIILGTFLGLLINYMIKKLPNKDNKLTIYISNTLLLLLGITVITKLVSSVYLDKTGNIVVMIPFLILITYSALKNRYSLMKVISILNIIYLLMILFAFSSLLPTTDLDFFKPIGISGPFKIILGALEYALYSTTPLIVLPEFKEKYDYKVYLLSSLFLLIIFVLIIGNLGTELSSIYRYPEYMIFKNIAILDFIENTHNILFFVWIINIYTLTSHTTLNIREIVKEKGLIITLIILAIIINMFIINTYKTPIIFLNYLDYIVLGILSIYIIGKILGKEKHIK